MHKTIATHRKAPFKLDLHLAQPTCTALVCWSGATLTSSWHASCCNHCRCFSICAAASTAALMAAWVLSCASYTNKLWRTLFAGAIYGDPQGLSVSQALPNILSPCAIYMDIILALLMSCKSQAFCRAMAMRQRVSAKSYNSRSSVVCFTQQGLRKHLGLQPLLLEQL